MKDLPKNSGAKEDQPLDEVGSVDLGDNGDKRTLRADYIGSRAEKD